MGSSEQPTPGCDLIEGVFFALVMSHADAGMHRESDCCVSLQRSAVRSGCWTATKTDGSRRPNWRRWCARSDSRPSPTTRSSAWSVRPTSTATVRPLRSHSRCLSFSLSLSLSLSLSFSLSLSLSLSLFLFLSFSFSLSLSLSHSSLLTYSNSYSYSFCAFTWPDFRLRFALRILSTSAPGALPD